MIIPYTVARYFAGTERVNDIYFSMRDMHEVTDAATEIKRVVSSRHRANSVYKTQTLQDLLTTAAEVADAMTAVLVLVAAVTLAVGGIGIMNIMLAMYARAFAKSAFARRWALPTARSSCNSLPRLCSSR